MEGTPPDEEGADKGPNIFIDQAQMAGVWANFARVSHSPHEFTLDFVRLDFESGDGVVVARVSVSPLFITQLIEALSDNWAKYAEKALPKDFDHRDEPNDDPQD